MRYGLASCVAVLQAEESAGGALGRSHHGANNDSVPGYSSANGAQGCRQAGNDVLSALRSRVRGAGPFPLTKPVPLSQAEARRLMPPPPPRRPAPELGSKKLESAVSRESTGEGTAGRDDLSKGQPPAQNTGGWYPLHPVPTDDDLHNRDSICAYLVVHICCLHKFMLAHNVG